MKKITFELFNNATPENRQRVDTSWHLVAKDQAGLQIGEPLASAEQLSTCFEELKRVADKFLEAMSLTKQIQANAWAEPLGRMGSPNAPIG